MLATLKRLNPITDWMDPQGQQLAERVYQSVIIAPSIVGFFHGYAERDFVVTFYWWLGASLLAGVLTIPSWPCLYQRHKVVWADQEEEVEPPAPTHAAPARSQGGGGGKRR